MANQSVGARVQDELEQAVGSHLLPASVQEKAEKLLTRLKQPVRLALLGLPNSGKSKILNLLVGSEVIPEGVDLPSMQLTYGGTAQAVCTLPDGSKRQVPGADIHDIVGFSPVFIDMQLPLPALAKISILEVVAPDDPTAMNRACQWAAGRTEVALWCTQGFSEAEQALWSPMPDILKDHAFLMITKADFLNANGMMEPTLEAVRSVATDEFNNILPIATLDAIAARKGDGTVDKAQLRNSGGTALISAVLKQVELGRQTAVDMADVLLHQNADVLADNVVPTKEDVPEPTKVEEPAAAAPPPEKAPTVKPAKTSDVVLHPASRKAYEEAIAYIVKNSFALIDLADDMADDAPSKIISQAVEQVQWVSDFLNENGDDADEALKTARNTAMDAADLIQLMQMEKQDSATIEALSLLLQLKHELQADLAA